MHHIQPSSRLEIELKCLQLCLKYRAIFNTNPAVYHPMAVRTRTGRQQSGTIRNRASVLQLIFSSLLLLPFLLLFSSPFWLFLAFPDDLVYSETAICVIPSVILVWITLHTIFRLWSYSEVSVNLGENQLTFSQSLIFTPWLRWRTIEKPLSEFSKIETGTREYQRSYRRDPEWHMSNSEMDGSGGVFSIFKREENHPGNQSEYHEFTDVVYYVVLKGYNESNGESWKIDISSVVFRGTSKLPDLQLLSDLSDLLGFETPTVEDVFPGGKPKQMPWPILLLLIAFFLLPVFLVLLPESIL